MKSNKKKRKTKMIDGVMYEAITSNYDGRVIGWGKVYEDDKKQRRDDTMSNKEKASELLQFMEEEWEAKDVINALNPLLKDEDLAAIYDDFIERGIIKNYENRP